MKTTCPCCQTVYDDARITPGMIISCTRCNQSFQAFPSVELSTVVVEDSSSGKSPDAPPQNRHVYKSEFLIFMIIKICAHLFTLLLGTYVAPFFFLLADDQGTAVFLLILLLALAFTGFMVHEKIVGEWPNIRLALGIGVCLSMIWLLCNLTILRKSFY